jgi:hypothetical protein
LLFGKKNVYTFLSKNKIFFFEDNLITNNPILNRMPEKSKDGKNIGEERNSLYYIELIEADPEVKKKEGYSNSWPFYVSIGKIWNEAEIYENPELGFLQETVGEYKQTQTKIDLKKTMKNERMDILFQKLFKSGLFLYLHTEDMELNYNDDFLYDTLKRLIGIKEGEMDKDFSKKFENEYLCTLEDVNQVVKFGNSPTSKSILKTCIETYDALDEHLVYLYEKCMEFLEEPLQENLERRQGFIRNLQKVFLLKKSEICTLMIKLVVALASMFLRNPSELILIDSKCVLTIEKIIMNCFDSVKEDLFPGEKAKGKSKEKIKNVMLPENNSDLSWFSFTQLALEEVFLLVKQSVNSAKIYEEGAKHFKSQADFIKSQKASEKKYNEKESLIKKHKKKFSKRQKRDIDQNLLLSAKQISDRKENMNPTNRKFLKISLKNQEILLKKDAERRRNVNEDLLLELNKTRRQLGKEEIHPGLKNKLLSGSSSWKVIQDIDFRTKKAPLLLQNGDISNSMNSSNSTKLLKN